MNKYIVEFVEDRPKETIKAKTMRVEEGCLIFYSTQDRTDMVLHPLRVIFKVTAK